MSLSDIFNLIKVGNVKEVLRQIKDFPDPSDLHKILVKLNSVCYKNTPALSTPAVAQDVFSLAERLCQTISSTGVDFPKIVLPLYHITNYLLKHNPLLARDICKYFFQVAVVRTKSKSANTKEEEAVYCNLVHIFTTKWLDQYNRLEISSGQDSIEAWLEFTYRLSRLRANDTLQKMFQVIHLVLVKRSENRLNKYLSLCFSKLRGWLAELAESKARNSSGVIESFAGLVQLVLALVPNVKDFAIHVMPMVGCIAEIQACCPESTGAMEIVESALVLCQALENRNGPTTQSTVNYHLNRLTSTIAKQPPKMNSVLPIVHTLLYTSRRNLIAANATIESTFLDIFSVLLALSEHTNQTNDVDLKKTKKRLEIVYMAFSILSGMSASKEVLEQVFPNVKKFVKLFCKTATHADKEGSHFSGGVAELLNVMNAYKRAELTVESAQMCQYIFTVFSEMDPDFLHKDPYFKNYIEVWLKSWATSCVKNTYWIAAQVMIIIFAQRHPKFTIEAMKAWASLKKSKAVEVKMHATVLDVLNVNNVEIEQNNPDLKVVDFDIGRLLLGEAYAYSKSRDLYGEPVLNVYKAAAKATKKNYIALANILCCTVDAFTCDVYDKTHFATLDASVSNMIAHLQKVEWDLEPPAERAALFCSLGNLFYYKARLERQRIRQNAEAELSEEKSDLKLPVIRSGEKDDLDVTEVVTVGSSLKISNLKLLWVLEKAVECWAKCVDSLEPSILLTPTFSAIKGAGYLFRLYGYRELEASCWNHCFQIASKLGSEKHQFLATGELLAVRKTVDPAIISCVEGLKFDRKSYACLVYQVNFARNFLLQGKVEECRQAIDKINTQSLLYCFLANAQYKILLALFNMNHPANLKTHEVPLALLAALIENLMYLIVKNQWETHNEATVVQLLVLETAHLLSSINADMKYVRPARSYMKCGLPLSKKLALPARVCQVMTLGCWVDLLTWNVTESEINAQEVESLLELGVLKLGDRRTVCSPRRDSGLKIVPHFLSKENCKCQCCAVSDYPSFVLDAISNRVQVLIGNEGHREAHQVIGIGMKVLEFVEEKEATARTLSAAPWYSVARFYYVTASTNALWQKHEDAIRYATLASRALDSAPVKNVGLDMSIKRLMFGVRWMLSYKRPVKLNPVSRRFASGASITSAVTPEHIPTVKADMPVRHSNPKHVEKGYYDVAESEKLARKSLYSREGDKEGCGIDELGGISKLSVSPVPKVAKKTGKPTKTYGTHLHVPNSTNETLGKHNTPESRVSGVPTFARKLELPSKSRAITAKNLSILSIQSFFKAIDNQLHPTGSQTPERADDGSAKYVFCTPPNPGTVEGSSIRKARTEKKPLVPKANILGTPCMASLAKIGIGVKTPAIKVYYDPEGLESTAKKQKSKSTVKKSKRLATKGAHDKLGTPMATRTRAAKEKVTFDEDSSDEIELVSAQFKRLLVQKERSVDEVTFKKPATAVKNSRVEEEKVSTEISAFPPKFGDVNKDDSGSTDSFHSTSSHFDDTFDSFPPMKKPLASYSKKWLAPETNVVPPKDESGSTDSYFSLCSDDTSGSLPPMKKTVTYSSTKELVLEGKLGKLAGAMAVGGFSRLVSKSGEKCEAADDFEPSEKSADVKPSTSRNPRCAVIEEAVGELESSEVLTASTKKHKARRAIFDDTAVTSAIEHAPEATSKSRKEVVGKLADLKPCGSRNLRRANKEQPEELSYRSESVEVIVAPSKTLKARRAMFDDTVDILQTESLPEAVTTSRKLAVGKAAGPAPSKLHKPMRVVEEEPQNVESGELESLKVNAASLKTRKPRRAIFDDTADNDEPDSLPSEVVVSPFRKVIDHSASRQRQLFDETSVDLTNETVSDEIATVALVKQETQIGKAKSSTVKAGKTTHEIFKNTVSESDLDATMVAAPFRKLAKSGQSGVASRAKPVIHDETLDQEEEDCEGIQECKQSRQSKAKANGKTQNRNLDEMFDMREEGSEGQNSEIIDPATREKVKGSFLEAAGGSKARLLKLAIPAVSEVDKLGGKRTAAKLHPNAKKAPNLEADVEKVPAEAASKSATVSFKRVPRAELKRPPSTAPVERVTSRAVAAESSKDVKKPTRLARVIKETKPGLSKHSAEMVTSAKGLKKAASSTTGATLPDSGNAYLSSGATCQSLVDEEGVEATSKAVAAGSSKAAGQAASLEVVEDIGARPRRGARASKDPQPGGQKRLAKTAKPAKTLALTVPSPNAHRKSPNHENVDPSSTATSPSLSDSSIIESSFLAPSTEMKLPLAQRSLAEEMNKLTISSKPSKNPDKTNPGKETRRNVRK